MRGERRAFADQLYADSHGHDADQPDRLARWRNVEPETAELLGVLVRGLRARRILEIGTSNGYSAIWLGDAAQATGGNVVTLEVLPERAALAGQHLRAAGVADTVEVRTEDAAAALSGFADGAFDLIFLDAERPFYVSYWPNLVRVLRPRGLLVVDNCLSHAKELVEFSELVYSAAGVTSTLVTVGAGVLLIVKSG